MMIESQLTQKSTYSDCAFVCDKYAKKHINQEEGKYFFTALYVHPVCFFRHHQQIKSNNSDVKHSGKCAATPSLRFILKSMTSLQKVAIKG